MFESNEPSLFITISLIFHSSFPQLKDLITRDVCRKEEFAVVRELPFQCNSFLYHVFLFLSTTISPVILPFIFAHPRTLLYLYIYFRLLSFRFSSRTRFVLLVFSLPRVFSRCRLLSYRCASICMLLSNVHIWKTFSTGKRTTS